MIRNGNELCKFCIQSIKEQNKTVYDFCKYAGISNASFSRWKKGMSDMPRLSTVIKMAEYLNMTVSQLLGEEKNLYTKDVKEMADMIECLDEPSKTAVYLVIKTFYDNEMGKKEAKDSFAG